MPLCAEILGMHSHMNARDSDIIAAHIKRYTLCHKAIINIV